MGQPAYQLTHEVQVQVDPEPLTQRRWRLSPGRVLMIGIILYFIVMLGLQQAQISRLKGEVRGLEEKVAIAAERNAGLEDRLAYLASNEYIELLARRELGLVKENEIVIKGIGNSSLQATQSTWR